MSPSYSPSRGIALVPSENSKRDRGVLPARPESGDGVGGRASVGRGAKIAALACAGVPSENSKRDRGALVPSENSKRDRGVLPERAKSGDAVRWADVGGVGRGVKNAALACAGHTAPSRDAGADEQVRRGSGGRAEAAVVKAAEDRSAADRTLGGWFDVAAVAGVLLEPEVGAVGVVVRLVLEQEPAGVGFPEDNHLVEQLPADRADDALGVGIGEGSRLQRIRRIRGPVSR